VRVVLVRRASCLRSDSLPGILTPESIAVSPIVGPVRRRTPRRSKVDREIRSKAPSLGE
jgi:hypothetical protein